MRIIFFGTPEFAATILEYLLEKNEEIIAVVTRPDKPKGRSNKLQSSPVKELALKRNLPLFQPRKASDPEFVSFLKTLSPDLFIVAAYAEILKDNLLAVPQFFAINVHASILPKYRGAAPIQRAIMAGEKETGVTIMKMARELDAGDILKIEKIPIGEEMTAGELTSHLAQIGAKALFETLSQIKKGEIRSVSQNGSQSTYAKKITPEEGEIDWSKSSSEIFNHIRAFTPNPGAWVWVKVRGEKKRLLIKKAKKETSSGKPGEILSKKPFELIVGCGEGSLRLLEIQLEGKKEMAVDAFLRGMPIQNLNFEST